MVKLIVPILIIGLGLLSDSYLYHRYITTGSMWRWLWWVPTALIVCMILRFLFFGRGLVEEYGATNLFLLSLGIFLIPKIFFAAFSLIPKVGTYLGAAVAAGIIFIILYGISFGFSQIRVREVTYESPDIPDAFNGYRIAQFTDAHTGVFSGPYAHLLRESIDTINSLHPDLICFVGDIENFVPDELTPHAGDYSSLHAPDGVVSVMGNHDYSAYVKVSDRERAAMVAQTRRMHRSFGWRLLEDENITIRRGSDSISVIGEENWGLPPFPQYGKIKKAILGADAPVRILLSHDPNAWRAHILPVCKPNITLSGHTHGTQFSIFGWSPSSMVYREWGGVFREGDAMLSVSTGFGGNFPFRFGMPREVVLITLVKKK